MKNQGFSVLYALATIGSSFVLPFIGTYIDRVKLRNMSLINGIVLAIFCLVISFSSNRFLLLIGLFGLRLTGQGMMALLGSSSIARNFDKQRGKALSLSILGLSTGETIMPVLGVFLIGWLGWQHAWQIMSLLTVLIFVPMVLFIIPANDDFHIPPLKKKIEPEDQKDRAGLKDDKSRMQVLRDKRFYVIAANLVFTPFFITGMFIHHNLLAEVKGWTMAWIASCFVGYGITKTVSSLLAGPVVDRFSARNVLPFYLAPMAIGILSLIVLGNHPLIALIYLCMAAVSISLMSVSGTALWVELYGQTHFGAIKSMVTTMVVFASAIGPLVIGTFIGEEKFWQLGLIMCILVMLVVSTGSYLVLRHKSN